MLVTITLPFSHLLPHFIMPQTIEEAIDEGLAHAATDAPKRKPIAKGFYKGVSFAIFPKAIKRDDGTEVTVYSTVIEGRYRDKDGNYQSTTYFSEDQLVAVEDLAREARQHIREARARQKVEQ